MARPLLIFVGSPNVGPYINVMANSVAKYDVDSIALINMSDSPSGQQVDFANFANTMLWSTLCDLVAGKYKDAAGHEFSVPKNFDAYTKLKDVFGKEHVLHTVNYQFLRDGIEKLKIKYGSDAIVDVSSVPKRVAIDILTACLALGMQNVMLFELKKPMGGIQALYHALSETDYEHVVLPNWEPLLGNIEFYSARQNRGKLWTVLISIAVSLLLTIIFQLSQVRLGNIGWVLAGLTVFVGFFGGVIPIIDAWGGIRLVIGSGRRRKRIP